MKVKSAITTAVTAAAFGGIILGATASAQEVDRQDTEVGIGFVDAHIPGTEEGDLQLRWVPKKLDFGKYNDINKKYQEFAEVSGNSYYVVVRDTRKDDLTGTVTDTNEWVVKAQLGELTALSGTTTKKLDKTKLFFTSKVHGYDGENDPNTDATTIKSAGAHATATGSTAPTAATSTELTVGGASKALFTQKNQAASADWAASLEDIKLGVGGNVGEKGLHYTGTLTWTLDDTI
ncbi:WxL domain-containing protein [Enterococcus sp. LJL128]|uniref:WxL domain-containing protein n=1 Tax=Enterococcus sp. LJL51 TaxID=3416656 RepID=UPI003CE8BC82